MKVQQIPSRIVRGVPPSRRGTLGSSFRCPYCDSDHSQVIDSRPSAQTVRRVRVCPECDRRWTTYERADQPLLTPQLRDRLIYLRDGLLAQVDQLNRMLALIDNLDDDDEPTGDAA